MPRLRQDDPVRYVVNKFLARWQQRIKDGEARGIRCLDPQWLGSAHRYRFECALGHAWERPGKVLHERWDCLVCKRLEKVQERCFAAMRAASEGVGVTCLDTRWLGARHAYRFRCEQGHEWLRPGGTQTKHPRCMVCCHQRTSERQRTPHYLNKLKALAVARGGLCLTDQHQGSDQKFAFRCALGHEWQTLGGAVISGSWCPQCAARKMSEKRLDPKGLQRLQAKAAERQGWCLDAAYLGTAHRYRFRCQHGHEWETTGNKVLLGSWCPTCKFDAKRLSLEDAHHAAKNRGGQCLSTSYQNSSQLLQWRCDRGHEWQAPLSNVRAGHWCRQCANMAAITRSDSRARLKYADAGFKLLPDGVG